MIYQTDTNGVVTAIETSVLNEKNLGNVPTGPKIYHDQVERLTPGEIYETRIATSFSLDVETVTIAKGDFRRINVTSEPVSANLPKLIWECSKDAESGADVCFVEDGILRAVNLGTSTVTAYDVNDPSKKAIITVTVVEQISGEQEVEEENP
jgi:uncharacterized protein YjdB